MSEILIEGTYMDGDNMNSVLRDPYGSNRSSRSGKSLSIFQDPNASQTLARDEEITIKMYDNHPRRQNLSPPAVTSGSAPMSVNEFMSARGPSSSKLIMKRVAGSLAEGQRLSNGDPVELSGFIFHNRAEGSGVENAGAAKQRRTYTSHGGGNDNKYSRHSSTANKGTKTGDTSNLFSRRSSEGKVVIDEDRISRASSGFLFDGLSHLNGGYIDIGEGTFDSEPVKGDVDTPESKTVQSSTKTTTTTYEGPMTSVTQTTTKHSNTNTDGDVVNTTTEVVDKDTDPAVGRVADGDVVNTTREVLDTDKDPGVGHVAAGMKSERKAGAFTMKPATNWPIGRSHSNTSAHSNEFKASLDDTLSRQIKSSAKATSVNGDDGTFGDTESINTSRTNSMPRGAGKVSRSISAASRSSQRSGFTDGSSIPEDVVVHTTGGGKVGQTKEQVSSYRSDSYQSDLSRLVQEEDERNRKSVSRSSSASQTVAPKKSSASRDTGSDTQWSNRSSRKERQEKNKVTPVDPISNGGSNTYFNEDTIDRLVREEKSRDKRQSVGESSVVSNKATTTTVTTIKTVSTGQGSQPAFDTTNDGLYGKEDTANEAVVSKSASKTNTGDVFNEKHKIASVKEGKEIQSTIVAQDIFEKKREEGIGWFSSSAVDNQPSTGIDNKAPEDEQRVVQEEIPVAYKATSVQSDSFSKLANMSEGDDIGITTEEVRAKPSYQTSRTQSTRSDRSSLAARSDSQSQGPSASVSRDSSFHSRDAGNLVVESDSLNLVKTTQASGKAERLISPTAAAVQTDEFKSKLSSPLNESRVESSSTNRLVAQGKKAEPDLRLEIRQETATNIHGEASTSSNIQSDSLSRDESQGIISSASPVSPLYEARSQVREGTVGKIKHAFKDIQLTGGLAPSTLERKRQTDTSGTESDTGMGKKYKFAVEGIDVPSRDTEESQTDTAPSTLTRDGKVGTEPNNSNPSSPITSNVELDTSDADTLERKSLDRRKKGFSYLPIDAGSRLAGEIKRRADTVQASKPHEGLEAKKSSKSQVKPEQDSGVLKEARAKLHHKDLLKEIGNRKKIEEENESGLLKEARAKLTSRQQELSKNRQMPPPHTPSPIQAHMLLAQKAKLQKRSEANLTSEASSEVSEAESNKGHFEAKSRSKLQSQKTHDPNRPLDESTEASHGNKLAEHTSVSETTTGNKDSSVPTEIYKANPDIPGISVQSTHFAETETKRTVLRSVNDTKGNSQSFPAKDSERKSETPLPAADKSQEGQSHVSQTASVAVKAQTITEVSAERQHKLHSDADTPDSAYQSDAPLSPGFDFKPLMQTDNMKHPPVQEVEVRYARAEPVPGTSRGSYEASRKVVRETKSTTKTIQPAANGRLESNELQKSKKTEYNAITKPEANNEGQTQMKTSAYMITTNKGKQVKDGKVLSDQTEIDRRDHVQSTPISQEDIINAALSYNPENKNHSGEISGQVYNEPSPAIYASPASPEAMQSSMNESITASKNSQHPSNKTAHTEIPQIKVTSVEGNESSRRQSTQETPTTQGPSTFVHVVPVTYEDSAKSSPAVQGTHERDIFPADNERAAFSGAQPGVSTDITILNSSIPRKTDTGRRDSFNSTSTYSTQSSLGSHRVIPLRPLSVDVGQKGSRQPRVMKTHPHSPSSRSPTRTKHYQMNHSSSRSSSQPKAQKQKVTKTRHQNMKSESRSRREKIREDHLEVNIYGDDEDDSSIPSVHSPSYQYQMESDSHSGRVPRYRIKDIQVRNSGPDEIIDYNSSVERSSRNRSGPHVSNVHLDGHAPGDYVDYDSGSAYSEPNRHIGRSMGKYSIQKVMDRRGVNVHPIEIHPDNVYRKQKVYQVNRTGSFTSAPGGFRHPPHYDGTMRSNVHDATVRSIATHAHTTDALKSPEIAAVDPDLLAARKSGTDYNVSLKLNAMQVSRPGSRMSWEHDEMNQSANVTQYQNEYRNMNGHDQGGKHVSTVYNSYDDYNDWEAKEARQFFNTDSSHGRAKTDDYILTSVKRGNNANLNTNSNLAHSRDISRSVNDTREIHHQQFKQFARGPDRVDIDIELAPEDLRIQNQTNSGQTAFFHRNTKLRRSKSDPSMAKKFRNANYEPKFSMKINQTMTMDYTPQEHEIDDNNNRNERREQRQRRPPSSGSESESEQTYTQTRRQRVETVPFSDTETDTTIHEEYVVRSKKGMTENSHSQWAEDYFSPYDAASDHGEDDMPQVVRGSILIQNSIDPGTGGPHIIDVVDDDSDDDFVVDDNTNMFDRRYHATKNNPLYDSDNESPERTRPKFTDIFQKSSTHTAYAAPSHKTKSRRLRQKVNGYDEPEFGFDETVTKTTTYNVSAENKGRSKGRAGDKSSGSKSSGSRQTVQKSEWEINKLLAGAPPDSIKQTINVEREEEEIMGPLPANHADGSSAGPDGLLNFDTVSEKVDLGMLDGKAQVAVKVRCERIVPIRGVDDMFKKSSVIVTRLIEIDLTATEERQRLYEHIMRSQNRPMITSGDGAKHKYSKSDSRLSTKETFKLYKTFMGLAEADEVGKGQSESLKIDRNIDEEHRPDLQAAASNGIPANLDDDFDFQGQKDFDTEVLDRRLEDQMHPNMQQKIPEPDTISYSSAAPSTHDLIY